MNFYQFKPSLLFTQINKFTKIKSINPFYLITWFVLAFPSAVQAQDPIFTKLRTISTQELNQILTQERNNFITELGTPSTLYEIPNYEKAKYPVDIYRVQYESFIPELDNRPTPVSGLIAVPQVTDGFTLPMVQYQHGTVFGRQEVPSYAFIPAEENPQYNGGYETRLIVAAFASQGYLVSASDYFGLGDSLEPEGFTVKQSNQQANLDLYYSSLSLFDQLGITNSNFFLSGWSQGALVTLQFLEKIEKETTISVTAASTAAAPADPYEAISGYIYHPREIDAEWRKALIILSAFSYENYYQIPVEKVIRAEYLDNSRKIYERNYSSAQEFEDIFNTIPKDLKDLLLPEYSESPDFFANSDFGRMLKYVAAYQQPITRPFQMHYGILDEVISIPVALQPSIYQREQYGNDQVVAIEVMDANHRGTFLTAVKRQKEWFDTFNGTQPVPEPLTLLGASVAIGLGTAFKRRKAK